jgi:hypothetical protein
MSLSLTSGTVLAGLGPVMSLMALWLRLRWRTRHERARKESLVAIVHAMRQGGRIEERRPDGTWLRLTVEKTVCGVKKL